MMFRTLGLMISSVALSVACSGDDAAPTAAETSSGPGEPATASDSGDTASSSGSVEDEDDDESSGEPSTGETGDPSPPVKACLPQDEGGLAWIEDADCDGGAQCTATATCTLQSETPGDRADPLWSYALQCEGEWDNAAAAKNITKGVVVIRARRRLAIPDTVLDYNYAASHDGRGGSPQGASGLLTQGALTVLGAGTSTGPIIEGFAISGFAMCQDGPGDDVEQDCWIPLGIAGTSPEGEAVRTDESNSVVMTHPDGDYLVNAAGLRPCELPADAPAPTATYAIVHNSSLAQ